MEYVLVIVVLAAVLFLWFYLFRPDENTESQRALDAYLSESLSAVEIGRFYERYIGHLYEVDGYDVQYNGALNGVEDMGRDLIVRGGDEVFIVQTKCWSKNKLIQESHIFQLYGSMTHFMLTSRVKAPVTKAVFYTTAKYSDVAREVARVLGVELRTEELNRSYPMIKCSVSADGEKTYHLPFDPYYDKIKIRHHNGEFFAQTVQEAVAKGFGRAKKYSDAA